MNNRTCLRCSFDIDEKEIKEDSVEFWVCPECENKNYKYSTKSWLGTGRFEREHIIKKISEKKVEI